MFINKPEKIYKNTTKIMKKINEKWLQACEGDVATKNVGFVVSMLQNP